MNGQLSGGRGGSGHASGIAGVVAVHPATVIHAASRPEFR